MSSMPLCRRSFLTTALAASAVANPIVAHAVNVRSIIKGDAIKWQGAVIDLGPLQPYYKGRIGKGIWTSQKGLNKKGVELVKALQSANKDGLEAADYISALPANVNELKGKDLGAAELYLSQAFWKFLRDLSAGRTTPAVSEPDIIISRKSTDIRDWLKMADRKGPNKVIAALRPQHKQYALLQKLLAKAKKGSKQQRQIIVNMERWRWLPADLGKRHVLVNQAAFEMQIREKEKIIDKRRVVVGKPFHKTPMFSHTIQYAEFNPTWTVPRSIAGNEMLPKIRRNPGYLEKNGYKLYTSWEADAPAMNPESVDWNAVSAKKFPFRIVQQPGDNNALGQVKFLFPNKFNVYLHDTQSKKLFSQSARAFSHGCIRVEKPLEFAEKLFGKRTLNQSKIKKILSDPATHRVDLRKPVPVHLTYFTVWIEDNGKAKYHADVYGRDKLVSKILFGRA